MRQCTEVSFASSLSGGFITAIAVNPPERKLAKHTSAHCGVLACQKCTMAALEALLFLIGSNEFASIFNSKSNMQL